MFTIQMDSGFSGVHMGLVFANGTAQTDDAFLATRLKSKGYTVTAEKGTDDTETPEQMEEPEGKKAKGKKPDDKKVEEKKRGGNNSRNKPANNAEPASTPEPTPEATVEPASESEPESNEPSNLPPLDNEGDE